MPLTGAWPKEHRLLRGRPALEMVLTLLPGLVEGFSDISGTHLRSVASLGDHGLEGLSQQTVAVLKGNDPDTESLGYRAAFEVVPQMPRGTLIEVRVPVFHGDLLILHLRAKEGQTLKACSAREGLAWVDRPPTSREVAVSPDLLVHLATGADGQTGILTLGFDPILWGALRPVMRLLELGGLH
jgi:aspartate-semialdehyde dehydrogenase